MVENRPGRLKYAKNNLEKDYVYSYVCMYVCILSSSFGQMRWVWVVAVSFNTTTKQTQRNVAPGEELHLWIELNTKVHARRPSNLEDLERSVKEEWALPRRHVWDLVHN